MLFLFPAMRLPIGAGDEVVLVFAIIGFSVNAEADGHPAGLTTCLTGFHGIPVGNGSHRLERGLGIDAFHAHDMVEF